MIQRSTVLACVILFLLSGCSPSQTPTPSLVPATPRPSRTPPPTATEFVTAAPEGSEGASGYPGHPLPAFRGQLFSTSGACSVCHSNLKDESGADVSIDRTWRSSIKANSARDPYWQASVRAEVNRHANYKETIEDKCAACHMPMAQVRLAAEGRTASVLGEGLLNQEHGLHDLAMDGVSCALCHQIREEGLGSPESYSGGFQIDQELPFGERLIFGPYSIEEDQAQIMTGASGFVPVQGLHIQRSELCATCHTLFTPYLDDSGEIAGEFPEQMPYQEWFYSDYRNSESCQSCHMPRAQGGVPISTTSTTPRSPFTVHDFVGGNAYMLEIFKTFGEEMGLTASSQQFESSRQRTLAQLQERTANMSFQEIRLSGSRLTVEVLVDNLAGHKFPTSFPSRRAWLHLLVENEAGEVLFESGGWNPAGLIVGNDNDADPTAYEPHYNVIVQNDQVQIYEAILGDVGGNVTTGLLRAARYLKDNRLLPVGFDMVNTPPEIEIHGRAGLDADFLDGSDLILYSIDLGDVGAPARVTVQLLYQSIGYRWAENLRGLQGREIDNFLRYYDQVPNEPVLVDEITEELN